MAMEWTKADVKRVMDEARDTSGVVHMPTVRTRFNLMGRRKNEQFDRFVAQLAAEGFS